MPANTITYASTFNCVSHLTQLCTRALTITFASIRNCVIAINEKQVVLKTNETGISMLKEAGTEEKQKELFLDSLSVRQVRLERARGWINKVLVGLVSHIYMLCAALGDSATINRQT
jgi:hypothetical protein